MFIRYLSYIPIYAICCNIYREGMLKMREVYENNPALGDANTLNKKVEQNAEKLNSLQTELRKYQVGSGRYSSKWINSLIEIKCSYLF